MINLALRVTGHIDAHQAHLASHPLYRAARARIAAHEAADLLKLCQAARDTHRYDLPHPARLTHLNHRARNTDIVARALVNRGSASAIRRPRTST
ncbi:hypothetical protein, partial [Burkholderia gladioli]|uniref:hypothetical protein n=1 Tax=Burkholderia gladioli TaxID=28095 RepID=UPI001ABA6631